MYSTYIINQFFWIKEINVICQFPCITLPNHEKNSILQWKRCSEKFTDEFKSVVSKRRARTLLYLSHNRSTLKITITTIANFPHQLNATKLNECREIIPLKTFKNWIQTFNAFAKHNDFKEKKIKLLYFFFTFSKKMVMLKINFPLRAKSSLIVFSMKIKRLVLDTAMPALFPYYW